MKDDIVAASVKAAPPVAVTGAHQLFHLSLNDWVAIATLIYIILQAFFLVRNEMRKRKEK